MAPGLSTLMEKEEKYIFKSSLPAISYPAISVGEYLAQRMALYNPETIAFVSWQWESQLL